MCDTLALPTALFAMHVGLQ